ncbi:probable serine/threonine-protein kinase dyrk2 [Argopecten irradians]|uniref:probable serine/threonine-protein kinase dyrk2 n=1 Tax=Argopecten irradians TaxID=31199 RepID=UPI00371279E4
MYPTVIMKKNFFNYVNLRILVHIIFLLVCVSGTKASCTFDPPTTDQRGSCSTDGSLMTVESLSDCNSACLNNNMCLASSHNPYTNRCFQHTCVGIMSSSNYVYYLKQCTVPTTTTTSLATTTTTTTATTTTTTPAKTTTTTIPETTTTTPETTTTAPETTTTPEITTKEISTPTPSREISAMWTAHMMDYIIDTDSVYFRSDLSVSACLSVCTYNSSCVTVFYDSLSRSCQGHLYTYNSVSPGLRFKSGSVYYIRNY